MKIKQAFIYGFGKWVDYSIDFPENNFVCIYGENESGKSTLQKFILFMLFGLYPKERAFYRPKTSSKMGGRLTIIDQEIGEVMIERLDHVQNGKAICYTEKGEQDEEWLRNYMQGMTAKTYQSVFSFSALDLFSIHEIREEDMSEILLSIGLTGSTHIHTLDKKLEQQMGDLFKPFGKKPKINQQLILLKQLDTKRIQTEREINQYREQKEAWQQAEKEIIELQDKLQKEKEKQLFIEKKKQALPFIHPYKQAKEGLQSMELSIPFPEDGVNRLKNIKEKIIPLQSELTIYKKNMEELKGKIEQLRNEQKQMLWINEVKSLLERKPHHDYLIQEINELQEMIQQQSVHLETEISYMNVSISKEDLLAFEFPFQTEKTWASIKEMFENITAERNQLVLEKQAFIKHREQLKQEIRELEQNQLTKEERVEYEQKLQKNQETAFFKQMENQYDEQQKKLRLQKQQIQRKNRFTIGFSLCIAIISGILFLVNDSFIFMSSAIIGGILSIFFWINSKNSVSTLENIFSWNMKQPKSLLTEAEHEEISYRLIQDDENQLRLTNLEETWNTLHIKYQLQQEQYINWEIKEQQLDEQIAREQAVFPFLMEVKVEDWPTLYHSIKRLMKEAREIEQLEEKQNVKEKEQHNFEQNVSELSLKMKPFFEGQTISNFIPFFEQVVEQYDKNQTDLENDQKAVTKLEKQIQHLQEHVLRYEEELQNLFTFANVSDEDGFYKRAKEIEMKEKHERMIQQIHAQFATIFSDEEWESILLENKTERELIICQEQQKETIRLIEQRLEKLRQAVATYQAQMEKIETSETHSELVHRLEMEKEQLITLSKRWAVLKTAQAMLRETKQVYKEKYLQHVLDQATTHFSHITNKDYHKIIAPSGEQPFLVESNQQVRYSIHELSQGTIDQLYISLRLAIGEVMGDSQPFPFIMDDAFVHFDSIRLKRILPILRTISERKQIIFFTCKQEILENVLPENKIELSKAIRVTL